MIRLEADGIVLRGFHRDEIDLALERMQPIPPTELDREQRRERRGRLERSGTRTDWEVMLAIESEGRLVGDVQARSPRYAFPPGVWELGIELWAEADRGRGLGRQAVALLTSHLFEREDAIRVQATTDVENGPMRAILEALGFGFEGVLRGFMPSPTQGPRDYAMYAITKDDWTKVKDRWTRTS